jgi:MEDS: MEthanogen/methylotroph, DcmR Sensory domain
MAADDNALRIAPNALDGSNRHICAFFNGMDEHYRVLGSFIKEGFDEGDRAFHLVDPERREDHLRRLEEAGIDVDAATTSGQLEVRPWEDGPLHGEHFDQDTWVAGFEEVLRSGPAAGYPKTRYVAQMEWALVDMPGIEEMMEFETRVNYVVPKYDDTVLCSYDLLKFSAGTVMYALLTHPLVIIGGVLHENPFYVDPDQLLAEVRERRLSGERAVLAH